MLSGSRSGSQLRRRRDAEALEGLVCHVLVAHLGDDLARGKEDGRAQLPAALREDELVEIGERDDEVDVVLDDEAGELRHVLRVADARNELVLIRVVERRGQAVDVGRDRRRAGSAEGGHDVDALAGAGEKDGRHRGMSVTTWPKTPLRERHTVGAVQFQTCHEIPQYDCDGEEVERAFS